MGDTALGQDHTKRNDARLDFDRKLATLLTHSLQILFTL